jgi:hypothetical protein
MKFSLRAPSIRAASLALALLQPFTAHAQPPDDEADFEIEIPAEEPAAPSEAQRQPPAEPPSPPPPEPDAGAARLEALEAELARLRSQVEALEAEPRPETTTPPEEPEADEPDESPAPTRIHDWLATPARTRLVLAPRGVGVSGYVQVDYAHSAVSEDQLLQSGDTLNEDGFVLRRGRAQLRGNWRYAAAVLEVDANTVGGPNVGVRRANVTALYRNPDEARTPYAALTVGVTEMPFGQELQMSQKEFLFMERSMGSNAFFSSLFDLGVVAFGGVGPFRYQLGVMNGTPIGRGGRFRLDPTRAPDYFGRVGVDVEPKEWFHFVGGVSFMRGTGLHPGETARESGIQWLDYNENGTVDTGEIVALPGRGATPSKTFGRWAVGADLAVAFRSRLGWSRLFGEITMASNLDRGLYVADPITLGADVREIAGYVRFEQELTRYAVLGARYDYYDPNADFLDSQRGLRVPSSAAIQTLSPLVGAIWPGRGRIVLQYDAIFDSLGRTSEGTPADRKNNRITVRVQGEF